MAGLRGKPVLIDIWDYTCINCLRTLPYLIEWQNRYAPQGLTIIGVHTPEFEFAELRTNVEAAVQESGIRYPVVLDNNYQIWKLYANRAWPSKYLVDPAGYIVYHHAGEGDYHETEAQIRKYLTAADPTVQIKNYFTAAEPAETGGLCYPTTPELYLGYDRRMLGNSEGQPPEMAVHYKDGGEYKDGVVYAHGLWLNLPQSMKHARQDPAFEDHIAIRYHAAGVNAVIRNSTGREYTVQVKLDGEFVRAEDRGADLLADGEGKTCLTIRRSRMYRIIKNRSFGEHVLTLHSDSDRFDIYSFTFGSCEAART